MTGIIQGSTNISHTTSTEASQSADLQSFEQKLQTLQQMSEQIEHATDSLQSKFNNLEKMMDQYRLSSQVKLNESSEQESQGAAPDMTQTGAINLESVEHTHQLEHDQVAFNAVVKRLIQEYPTQLAGRGNELQNEQFLRDSNTASDIMSRLTEVGTFNVTAQTRTSMKKFGALLGISNNLSVMSQDQSELNSDPASRKTDWQKNSYASAVSTTNVEYKQIQGCLKDVDDPELTSAVNQILDNYNIPNRGDQ